MINNDYTPEFNYDDDYVIGYVSRIWGSPHARLKVVGILSNGQFLPLTPRQAREIFYTQGEVFAHNFPQLDDEKYLFMVKVLPNKNTDRNDYCAYVWNKAGNVAPFFKRAISIDETFSNNGQYNYSLLEKYGLVDIDEKCYVSSGPYIWLIDPKKNNRFVPYWNRNVVETITVEDKLFVVKVPNDDVKTGSFDITNDEQLLDWFLNKVLKEEWSNLVENKNFGEVESMIRSRFKVTKQLTEDVIENRIHRLLTMTNVFTLPYETVKELSQSLWLKESIEMSLAKHQDAFMADYKRSKAEEIQAIDNQFNQDLALKKGNYEKEKGIIDKQLQEKQSELEGLESLLRQESDKVKTLENSIQLLEKHKESIVEDYTVVREVLHTGLPAYKTSQVGSVFSLEEVSLVQTKCSSYRKFIKILDDTLCLNGIEDEDACDIIGSLLCNYRMLLVPDAKMAQIIIQSTLCCRYLVEYVSASWRSFDDLWTNGLAYIVEQAEKDSEKMYYLVLQNINLTYLPNYMMPLIDIQSGLTTKIAGTGKALPNNLRILCTITKDDVMPLNANCLQYIGCVNPDWISTKQAKIGLPTLNESAGYLSPSQLNEQTVDDVKNYYEDYLQDE